jgi:hypothetical protein
MTEDEALAVLREAWLYTEPGTPFGFAARVPPEADAFEALLASPPDAATLERLLAEASPAGRVYAARLLAKRDAAAGRQAWRHLVTDTAEVSVAPGGCVVHPETVAAIAERMLQRRDS